MAKSFGGNLSGIVFAFAEAMKKICEESNANKQGTEWKNTHPIAVLFASKIASLTHSEDILKFGEAYNACCAEAAKAKKENTDEV
jgi:hypothetical protein